MTQPINLLTDKKLDQIATGGMWDFHGGIHPDENKQQSNQTAIRDAGIPAQLIIAVEQKGHVPELLVKIGDHVLKGQPLTKVYAALVVQHASSSGIVKAIEPRIECHPSGLPVLSIVIETDGLDRPFPYQGFDDYTLENPATLIQAVQQAGIVGLGGAMFASHLKLMHHQNSLLIINAMECEPYITADDRLIQEHPDEIIEGIQVLQHILNPKLTVFAIEDNKPEAIAAFNQSLQRLPEQLRSKIILKVTPTRYPSGSAKQLIEIITGEQTPVNKHSSELGIVMFNVGTVFAVKEAIINGKPLISRVVTLTGDAFVKKCNAFVRLGTPIQYLLDRYWLNARQQQKLIIGGPMMGFTISNTNMPVSATCNCILAPSEKELPQPETEMNCIRCSECAEVCPVELLPQQLLWYAQGNDHKKLHDYDLSACIECGACAFVCPSHIPLVEYFRVAKAQIKTATQEKNKASSAKKRHEDRALRLEKEKQQRQLKHQQAAQKRKLQMQADNNGEDLVAAALARAKARKSEVAWTPTSINKIKANSQNSQITAAIALAKAKKIAATASQLTALKNVEAPELTTPQDPRKAAVAAAIARAKAKKLAATASQLTALENVEAPELTTQEDPRKAAVAAAIARAKEKKLAATAALLTAQENAEAPELTTQQDPRKAAVAAAIARAKEKKLAATAALLTAQEDVEAPALTTPQDPRKAAVAAAIARAKAKKIASQHIEATNNINSVVEPDNSAVIEQRALRKEQARLYKQQQALLAPSDIVKKDDLTAGNLTTAVADTQTNTINADDKKAKIAAAIAKAKAKKSAQRDQ